MMIWFAQWAKEYIRRKQIEAFMDRINKLDKKLNLAKGIVVMHKGKDGVWQA